MTKNINEWIILYGFIICIVITIFCYRSSVIKSNGEFLFLQFGFYKFVLSKINKSFVSIFFICFDFLNFKKEFIPITDYVLLDKDSDSDAVLNTNILNIMPGTLGILVRKKNLIVHSLGNRYFLIDKMWDLTQDIGKIDDDSLV